MRTKIKLVQLIALFLIGFIAQTIADQVTTPVLSQASGTSWVDFEVEVTCATSGASIYYTTNGCAT